MRKILGLCLIMGLGLSGCAEKKDDNKNNNGSATQDVKHSNTTIAVDAVPNTKPDVEPAKPISNWSYNQKTDEMRGTKTKFASISSDNQVQFDFPYNGGSYLDITLRKRSAEPTEIMFTINDGQYSCDTISDSCFASVKFDNGDIHNIELSSTTDYSSDVLFISHDYDVDTFIKSLKKSKKLIIELPFYQEGKKQFSFTVSEINWGKGE
ncbi:hypothetical protein B9T31_17590 [Acinetobacter sp. ANC 4558]|uniref:hypothetical protein n=1 Tax=Acinetobacter sp. ANC 4558 TaxID=1977876 RepID=UPI000A346F8C|nr:hypothetical protein [Acinetobacter sp. ANC 4558]OTG78500.1 hypothetical protein B9T31_17590 [Acinetobacter sp. ANC 4558]